MNTKHQSKPPSARIHFQRWLLTNRISRLSALIVLAMAAAAIPIATLSFAQNEKLTQRAEPAPQRATGIPAPGKSAPARPTSTKSKRGSRNVQQKQDQDQD